MLKEIQHYLLYANKAAWHYITMILLFPSSLQLCYYSREVTASKR